MDALPLDVVRHIIPFLTNTDAALLSHANRAFCALIRAVPRIWCHLLIHTTWYAPYSHLWHKPYNAFLVHASHIKTHLSSLAQLHVSYIG